MPIIKKVIQSNQIESNTPIENFPFTEAAVQRCSYEKVFWKYTANLQDNTHAKVWFPFRRL